MVVEYAAVVELTEDVGDVEGVVEVLVVGAYVEVVFTVVEDLVEGDDVVVVVVVRYLQS